MRKKKLHPYFIILTLIITFYSCNTYSKLLKSNDFDAKYEGAMKCYEKGDFFNATQLFENLSMYYRGREKAEKIALFYAKSLIGLKDYYSAAYQFAAFVKQYPYSEHAEEALFQSAYCKYIESPGYSLDQTLTREAIVAFNIYIERYPNNQRSSEALKYVSKLQDKLMRKSYEVAYGYYKTMSYLSAYTALKDFMFDYPDCVYMEDVIYYLLKSEYEYAKKSIKEKQQIRYEHLISDIEKHITQLNNPDYRKEIQKLHEKGMEEIALLTKKK